MCAPSDSRAKCGGMCTVIVEVPRTAGQATRLLAVRDEMPGRPWDPPGEWWPHLPGVHGVRDQQAGGAWLATRDGALSVILNRAESVAEQLPENAPPLSSRGVIVLQSIDGQTLPERPHTESFNLIEVRGSDTTLHEWEGISLTTSRLEPGVHMIAHGAVDDLNFARVEAWLPKFQRLAGLPNESWRHAWIEELVSSAELGPDDDRAIIRDNTSHGYPTKSLLVCLAEIGESRVALSSATLSEAARWSGEQFIDAL